MTVGVVGLGLIGGSVALALRVPGRTVLGYDRNPEHQGVALERGLVDRCASLADVCAADVVFVAVPPEAMVPVLAEIAGLRSGATVVTDCASVKAPVVAWAREAKADWFVPGHPMAGHEKSGPRFASAWLFRDAKWLLTPVPSAPKTPVRTVETLIREMGAVPERVAAEDHDRHVALLSHVPHVLASVLLDMARDGQLPDAGGGSWRDLTRVGGAEPELWRQILLGNRVAVADRLDDLAGRVRDVAETLRANDGEAVAALFRRAAAARPAPADRTAVRGRRR